MDVHVKVDGEQLEEVLHAAVLQSLSGQAQEALVKYVVDYLCRKPTGSGYGPQSVSPLLSAVLSAAQRVADKIITERLEKDPEFAKWLDELYIEAFKQIENKRESVISEITSAMSRAMSRY